MTPLNCLIVDDEPIACDILLHYCEHFPFLKVLATCSNALEAKRMLLEHQVEVLFLDVQMPVLDGISFMKTLKSVPHVVFTTAYREFAADAFELSACDYLVKPFSLERFMIAVDKIIDRTRKDIKRDASKEKCESHLFIKADGNIYRIAYAEILFAEARGNYTKVVTDNKTLLTAVSFSQFECLFQSDCLVRIHRSYIINTSKMSCISGNQVLIDKHRIPIGSHYKAALLHQIGMKDF